MRIEKKTIEYIADNDVEHCVFGKNGLGHGDPEESDIAVYGHYRIEFALILRNPDKVRDDISDQDKKKINAGTYAHTLKKFLMGHRDITGKWSKLSVPGCRYPPRSLK